MDSHSSSVALPSPSPRLTASPRRLHARALTRPRPRVDSLAFASPRLSPAHQHLPSPSRRPALSGILARSARSCVSCEPPPSGATKGGSEEHRTSEVGAARLEHAILIQMWGGINRQTLHETFRFVKRRHALQHTVAATAVRCRGLSCVLLCQGTTAQPQA